MLTTQNGIVPSEVTPINAEETADTWYFVSDECECCITQAPTLTCRLPRIRKRIGRCYELAYQGCEIGREWTLVHGFVNGVPSIGRIDHAWLERDGWIFDPVLDELMLCDAYILKFQAESSQKYTYKEAAKEAIISGHYGPWFDAKAEPVCPVCEIERVLGVA